MTCTQQVWWSLQCELWLSAWMREVCSQAWLTTVCIEAHQVLRRCWCAAALCHVRLPNWQARPGFPNAGSHWQAPSPWASPLRAECLLGFHASLGAGIHCSAPGLTSWRLGILYHSFWMFLPRLFWLFSSTSWSLFVLLTECALPLTGSERGWGWGREESGGVRGCVLCLWSDGHRFQS